MCKPDLTVLDCIRLKHCRSFKECKFINYLQCLFLKRSAAAIDELPIQFEGDTFLLREIADISKKDPKKVIIDTSAIPQATKIVMTTLESKTSMNLNPQQDGTKIYVPVPKVTKEVRQNLAKSAKVMQNKTIVKLKETCNMHISKMDNTTISSISEDQVKEINSALRLIQDHFVTLTKEMAHQKEQDLLNK